jgi:hypothetical protein
MMWDPRDAETLGDVVLVQAFVRREDAGENSLPEGPRDRIRQAFRAADVAFREISKHVQKAAPSGLL